MKKLFLIPAILAFNLIGLRAQILNVESQRIQQDSTGWVGKADFTFNLTSNQKQVLDLNSSLHVQYRSHKNTYILLGGAGMIRAGNSDFDNSGHIHFRYNRDMNPWLTWEAFAQGQYNRVLMIDHRELIGTGPRFQLLNLENSKLYAASLYMLENEVRIENKESVFNHRLSNYVAFNWKINDHVAMNNIVYFQPVISSFDDHRIMLQSGLKFRVTEMVGFAVNFNLLHNSNPPAGVTKTVYSVRNGLEVRL
jgi:putative salt-induced outer membrane protein YdiY